MYLLIDLVNIIMYVVIVCVLYIYVVYCLVEGSVHDSRILRENAMYADFERQRLHRLRRWHCLHAELRFASALHLI